jgi:hypothetical protein
MEALHTLHTTTLKVWSQITIITFIKQVTEACTIKNYGLVMHEFCSKLMRLSKLVGVTDN